MAPGPPDRLGGHMVREAPGHLRILRGGEQPVLRSVGPHGTQCTPGDVRDGRAVRRRARVDHRAGRGDPAGGASVGPHHPQLTTEREGGERPLGIGRVGHHSRGRHPGAFPADLLGLGFVLPPAERGRIGEYALPARLVHPQPAHRVVSGRAADEEHPPAVGRDGEEPGDTEGETAGTGELAGEAGGFDVITHGASCSGSAAAEQANKLAILPMAPTYCGGHAPRSHSDPLCHAPA